MCKKFFKYFGDAFTKIGCGLFGGAMVSYYYNTFVFQNQSVNLVSTYFSLLLLGVCLLLGGYVITYFYETSNNLRRRKEF